MLHSSRIFTLLALFLVPCFAIAASQRVPLGVFEAWGAFRDSNAGRCHAIASPEAQIGGATTRAYASVGFWPKRGVRGQFYVRLSRAKDAKTNLRLAIGGRRFVLVGNGTHGWASDARMDAAIVSAMRSAPSMSVESRGSDGRIIADAYRLRGAATAIDAAALGCAGMR